jgi:hypothetical protein
MAYNKIIIRRGSGVPTTSNLDSYSLGWSTNGKKLYINDNGTIRVIAGQNPVFTDAANTFAADKTQIFSGPVNFTNTVTLTTSPTNNNDVTNKQYVDSQIQTYIQGLDIRESVVCATTPSETLSDWTYEGGEKGTLTAPSDGVGSIDDVTFTQGMRVLVKNRPGDLYNTIYTVQIVGDATHKAQLKEVESYNSLDAGIFVFVEQGTINQNTGWVISRVDPGEKKCIWTQFSGAGAQALATLSDVTLTNPALNHILYHNGTKWVNLAGPSTSSEILKAAKDINHPRGVTNLEWAKLELDDIDRFDLTNVQKGDILWYSGSEWKNLSAPSTTGKILKTTSTNKDIGWDTINLEQSVTPTSGNGSKLIAVNYSGTAFTYTDTIDGGTWTDVPF